VLERIEERDGIRRNGRAPGVAGAASEGQGENDRNEPIPMRCQNPTSAPS
jgi:hypothetical protein